jgi:hypothetical protein
MTELLTHPYTQAAFAPFLIALITAEVLLRLRISGLAIIAGLLTTALLTANLSLSPIDLAQKIILLSLVAAVLGLLLSYFQSSWLNVFLSVLATTAVLLLIWPLLQTHALQYLLAWGAGCVLFLALLVWGMDNLHTEPLRAANAISALGLGAGIAIFHSASLLYGEFALAIGAAASAHLLIQILTNQDIPAGRSMTLPSAILIGSVVCIAALAGNLPWYGLPLLAAIPLLAWTIPLPKTHALIQTALLSLMTFSLAASVVYFARYASN